MRTSWPWIIATASLLVIVGHLRSRLDKAEARQDEADSAEVQFLRADLHRVQWELGKVTVDLMACKGEKADANGQPVRPLSSYSDHLKGAKH